MGRVILPSLKEASTDRRLRGAPLRVLVYLHGVLEIGEYTILKLWAVADSIGMDRSNVSRAITTLTECGYIREGKREDHGVRTFMLLANHQRKDVA